MSLALVPDRVYSQYRSKPKFVQWFDIARKQGESIDDALEKIALMWDVDSEEGAQLDIIGRIVGVDRDFINKIELEQFQFGEDIQFGDDEACFSAGSVAQDDGMSDGLFRLLIKAKILKNNRRATIEDIIEQMDLLIGASFVKINNPENMTFSIEFVADLTPLQRYALFNENIIQIPQGVQFNGFTELQEYVEFGDPIHQFGAEESQFTPIGA